MDQQGRARLLQRVLEFVGSIRRVDIDQDRADPGGSVLDQHPFVPIWRPDADPVTLGNALGEQTTGHQADLVPELSIGGAIPLVGNDQRLVIGYPANRAPQILDDRLAQERNRARAVRIGQGRHLCHLPLIPS